MTLTEKHKRYIRRGLGITSDVVSLVLSAMLTVLLITILTVVIFACVFAVYVKANLSEGFEVSPTDFATNLSSTIYYWDPELEAYVESTKIQSTEYRIWLEYSEIPKMVEYALVAIEDQRFYKHYGVDWYRTTAALVNMFISMRDNFGGSTITQQLIKNITGDNEVTVKRKLEEIFRALEFEQTYTKEEIIQWYLNKVYFGRGSYGIAAASDTYFGKTVDELSIAEIASLIAVPNNPSLYDPFSRPEKNKDRQEKILKQMYIQGYITEQEYNDAVAEEIVFVRGEGYVQEQATYTWFEEAVIFEARADLAKHLGRSESAAMSLLMNGGYSIYSTMNPNVQQAIDDVYLDVENLPKTTGTDKQLQSAMVIIDPYTGHIVGLSGGVGEKPTDQSLIYSRATKAQRPPGSSIKPISVYAPAMDAGLITPDTKYNDSADAVLTGRTDGWLPKNDDREWDGIIDIRTAVVRSRNTISAQVLDKLTPTASYNFMTDKLGMTLDPADADYAPLALGQLTYGVTVREMASAYTMFLNSGVRIEGITYTKIVDANGNTVFENRPEQTVAISEVTAYWMTDILHDAATVGTGSKANLGKMPTAGKTGTSGDSNDRWFVGYTPYYVAATWCGYDMPEKITLAGGNRTNPAITIWKGVMSAIHEELEVKQFPVPANTYQTPVAGIKEVGVTVIHKAQSGTILETEQLSGEEGKEFTANSRVHAEFFVVGEPTQTITVNANESRNVITFIYEYVPLSTPEPSPSPTPVPTPTTDDTPPPLTTIDPFETPEPDEGDEFIV